MGHPIEIATVDSDSTDEMDYRVMREVGGCRKDSGGKEPALLREELKSRRARWVELQNRHLELNGHPARSIISAIGSEELRRRVSGTSGVQQSTK